MDRSRRSVHAGRTYFTLFRTDVTSINTIFILQVIGKVPISTEEERLEAVKSCESAFKMWSQVPIQKRANVMHNLERLIRDNTEELAKNITLEQGKTLPDARGDVFRGLEVVQHCCSINSLMMGETAGNLAQDLDTYSYVWCYIDLCIILRISIERNRHMCIVECYEMLNSRFEHALIPRSNTPRSNTGTDNLSA